MLLAHPREDRLFEQIASHAVTTVDDGARGIRAARRALRQIYPAADLHRQRDVLFDGAPTTMWFAYRDGRHSPTFPVTAWWRSRSVASASIGRSGELGPANKEFRSLLGLPPKEAGAEVLGDSLPPELCAELRRLTRWLARSGDMAGATEVRLPWGRRRQVEFHANWNVERQGQHQIAVRSVEDRDAATIDDAITRGIGRTHSRARDRLLTQVSRRDLAPGDGLDMVAAGEPWAVVVAAGIVRLMVRVDDLEPTLAYAGHGALLGTHLMSDGDAVPLVLQAVTPSVVLQLPASAIEDLIATDVEFAGMVVEQGQSLLRAAVMTFAARNAADVPQRLAREILLLSELQPDRDLIPITEQQLADGVGCIRESVGRTIGDFRRHGWLATTRYGLLVIDANGLRQTARSEMLPSAGVFASAHGAA
jgi:CRP-like cAMP-binding protein